MKKSPSKQPITQEFKTACTLWQMTFGFHTFQAVRDGIESLFEHKAHSDEPEYYPLSVGLICLYARPFTNNRPLGPLTEDIVSGAAKFSDPADWDDACVEPSQIDDLEPLPDVQSDYRTAAQNHMETLKAIDDWMSTSSNARLAWTVCAAVFDLTSTRGFSVDYIAGQIGCSAPTLTNSITKFRALAGIDSDDGIQRVRIVPDRTGSIRR